MATVAVPFIHFDLTCKKGDELPDDHPLVELAPHLFVQEETKATTKKARP
jgi:hypothetical protein